MKEIKLICKCCGEEYTARVPSTCSKSCGGLLREQKRLYIKPQKVAHKTIKGKNNGWMEYFEIKK